MCYLYSGRGFIDNLSSKPAYFYAGEKRIQNPKARGGEKDEKTR